MKHLSSKNTRTWDGEHDDDAEHTCLKATYFTARETSITTETRQLPSHYSPIEWCSSRVHQTRPIRVRIMCPNTWPREETREYEGREAKERKRRRNQG